MTVKNIYLILIMAQPECFDEDLKEAIPGMCSVTINKDQKGNSQVNPFYTPQPTTKQTYEEYKIAISLHHLKDQMVSKLLIALT